MYLTGPTWLIYVLCLPPKAAEFASPGRSRLHNDTMGCKLAYPIRKVLGADGHTQLGEKKECFLEEVTPKLSLKA